MHRRLFAVASCALALSIAIWSVDAFTRSAARAAPATAGTPASARAASAVRPAAATYPADIYEQDDVPADAQLVDTAMYMGVDRARQYHTFDHASATQGDQDWFKFYVSAQDISQHRPFLLEAFSFDSTVDPVIECYGPDVVYLPTFTHTDPMSLASGGLDWGVSPDCHKANDDVVDFNDGAAAQCLPWSETGSSGWYYFRVRPHCWGAAGYGDKAGGYYLRMKKGLVARVAGADRADTARLVSKETFYDAGAVAGSVNVVVVNGWNFPDALAASSLAGALDAPLLLTGKDSVPSATLEEIQRLGCSHVWYVGGPAAIGTGAKNAIWAVMPPVKYAHTAAGQNRYQTARNVVGYVKNTVGKPMSGLAFIVNGESWADALAVAPLAFATSDAECTPILLTGTDTLNAETDAAITDYGISNVVIVGGLGVVSDGVATQLATKLGGWDHVLRLGGTTRYQTAVNVALWAIGKTGPGVPDDGTIGTAANSTIISRLPAASDIGVASGENFPDALAGAALCGRMGMPMLLTNKSSLSKWIAGSPADLGGGTSYAHGRSGSYLMRSFLFGGSGAVADSTFLALDQLTGHALP